ncbi:MAG TPA: hypothetical protein DDZ80_02245 [Cyanobacteria bacterium UBA8803]|nr:hypothetical protein [Cyanobacteria bacterium UBA9273]HBL57405.1 hypothetical protein [Cyanobacteria bacterium UBA8803]
MNSQIEPLTLTVPLALAAHSRAEKFYRHQSNPGKAKQVYLNTLAVYAVNFYLHCQEFDTELEQSDSWNPVLQTLLDVADLEVPEYGKLECRPVLPGAEVVRIPAEVWQDRIGYVAVQLDESLQEATLLGFVEAVNCEEFPLRELRSLEELPGYLNNIKPQIDLSQWLEGVFTAGWQAVEDLLKPPQTELAFSFRSYTARSAAVSRGKLLDLGLQQGDRQIALLVDLADLALTASPEMDISVEIRPRDGQTELPPDLQLIVFNEDGKAMMQAEAGNCETLKFEFSGEPGEQFGVRVVLGEFSVTENFLI